MKVAVCLFILSSFLLSVYCQDRTAVGCRGCAISCEKQGPLCCGNGKCEADKGESCQSCPEDCGSCPTCDGFCGNKLCDANESPCSCPQDCGPCCCDGECRAPETFELCPGECGGNLRVQAIDYDTGLPLKNVNVTCYSQTSSRTRFTDKDGTVVLGQLEPSPYTCTATSAGYFDNSAHYVTTPGGKAFVPSLLYLRRKKLGTISGWVNNSLTGLTFGWANVSCSNANWQKDHPADYRGYFFIAEVPPGTYNCTAGARGFTPSFTSVTVTGGLDAFFTTSISPLPATLTVQAVDFSSPSTPLANLTVVCREDETGRTSLPARTDASGTVTFPSFFAERARNIYTCTITSDKTITATLPNVRLTRGQPAKYVVSVRARAQFFAEQQ